MIGFIGCGNMAKAIITGMINSGFAGREDIIASAASENTKTYIKETLKINAAGCNMEVVEKSDIVIFGIKPQMMEKVIAEIRDADTEGKVFVSLAPGKTFKWFNEQFRKEVALVRTAPNTPAMVGEGMTSITAGENVPADKADEVVRIFECLGRTAKVDEKLIDVASAVSGASPAFVFMFIEALADGAVAEGMPRKLAYELASQAVLGSGKMAVCSGKIPAQLKDEVTSPGGTTIEGINVLEDMGLRAAIMDAVRASVAKSRQI